MRPSLILLDMMMPEMDGWLLRQELKKSPELASIPIVILSGARRRARCRPGAGRGRLSAQTAAHRKPARNRRALLPSGLPELDSRWMRNRRWAVVVLAGALALAGVLASARAARAESDDIPADEDVRALPQGPLPTARWLTLETPHFELHFYPEEREFAERAARVAERAYRLITHYLNWQPKGRDQRAARRSDRPGERLRQLRALQLHLRVRRAARRDGRAVGLRRLRQAADHARVHPRRSPGHDPELVSAPGRFASWARSTRPTCRSRPSSSKASPC